MATSMESTEHSHMLVKYYDLTAHFSVVKTSDAVLLDDQMCIKFPDIVRFCTIIDTSDNICDLKAQIPGQSSSKDEVIVIDDDEPKNFLEPIDEEIVFEEPATEDVSRDDPPVVPRVYAIRLGPNGTMISSRDYNKITWNSYSLATRQLLMMVFNKDILATHTLTGRPKSSVPKHTLDAKKIGDIIHIVMEKCKVYESAIRQIISCKCTEAHRGMMNRCKKIKEMERRKK